MTYLVLSFLFFSLLFLVTYFSYLLSPSFSSFFICDCHLFYFLLFYIRSSYFGLLKLFLDSSTPCDSLIFFDDYIVYDRTSCVSFGNTLTWTLYGIFVANDAIIYIPNLAGLCLASFQMSLFAVYGVHTVTDGYEFASGIEELDKQRQEEESKHMLAASSDTL